MPSGGSAAAGSSCACVLAHAAVGILTLTCISESLEWPHSQSSCAMGMCRTPATPVAEVQQARTVRKSSCERSAVAEAPAPAAAPASIEERCAWPFILGGTFQGLYNCGCCRCTLLCDGKQASTLFCVAGHAQDISKCTGGGAAGKQGAESKAGGRWRRIRSTERT